MNGGLYRSYMRQYLAQLDISSNKLPPQRHEKPSQRCVPARIAVAEEDNRCGDRRR